MKEKQNKKLSVIQRFKTRFLTLKAVKYQKNDYFLNVLLSILYFTYKDI